MAMIVMLKITTLLIPVAPTPPPLTFIRKLLSDFGCMVNNMEKMANGEKTQNNLILLIVKKQ